MGDMADLLIDSMERSEVLIRHNPSGNEIVVSGTEVMYGKRYEEPEWTIIDENYQYD